MKKSFFCWEIEAQAVCLADIWDELLSSDILCWEINIKSGSKLVIHLSYLEKEKQHTEEFSHTWDHRGFLTKEINPTEDEV